MPLDSLTCFTAARGRCFAKEGVKELAALLLLIGFKLGSMGLSGRASSDVFEVLGEHAIQGQEILLQAPTKALPLRQLFFSALCIEGSRLGEYFEP